MFKSCLDVILLMMEWGSRVSDPINRFHRLRDLGDFDASAMTKWMFGGVTEDGYIDMGLQGQIFYMAHVNDALNLHLNTIYEFLSPLQREQVDIYVDGWKMRLLDLMDSKAVRIKEDWVKSFNVKGKVHTIIWRNIFSPVDHKSFIKRSGEASKAFYDGLSQKDWEKISEAIEISLKTFTDLGVRSSWLRYNLHILTQKAFELGIDDIVDIEERTLKQHGETLVESLFKLASEYGFKSDWTAATVFAYPTLQSRMEVEVDEWPYKEEDWESTESEKPYTRRILLNDFAVLTYAEETAALMKCDPNQLKRHFCAFYNTFWENLIDYIVGAKFDSELKIEPVGNTNCQMTLKLRVKT
ncbi:MAG: hypothetical protein GTN80_00800 [Nitrososphaeria archaeon]|nr:hypothetical protein [Nitrososphaeria archaeon]NIQ32184.1 hypothetical protein [Nitrososphaeria archaeon]